MDENKTIEIRQLIHSLVSEYNQLYPKPVDPEILYSDIAHFISENNWFGIVPTRKDGSYYIMEGDASELMLRIRNMLSVRGLTISQKVERMREMLSVHFPVLATALHDFVVDTELDYHTEYKVEEFLFEHLSGDLNKIRDDDVRELVDIAYEDEFKYIGQALTFFLAYARTSMRTSTDKNGHKSRVNKYGVNYTKDFLMSRRVDTSDQTRAYDEEEYLELLYYLMNEEYAEDHNMYVKAAESKNYADCWLFLSIHFISAMRNPNLEMLYHPILPMKAEEVLYQIKEGIYSAKDAKAVSNQLMEWMHYLQPKPTKTAETPSVPRIPFFIPISLEEHFGKLFSICEAHHQLAGLDDTTPLIRRITTYEQINRYMGEEIGSLFLERDFSSRKANKSYMQSIELFADPILANEGIDGAKNYILISMARSHKGGYGTFAKTTAEYLKDANFSGLSVEFVSKELFERGILSSISSMLLKILTGGEYVQYSPKEQTAMIKALNMRPSEIEQFITITSQAEKHARDVVNHSILSITDIPEERSKLILMTLHRLANGSAPSRNENVYCIHKAIYGTCAYKDLHPCEAGCKYEISTKASAYHLIGEYNRLKHLYETTTDQLERQKFKWLIVERILPLMNELLTCMADTYGEAYVNEFISILKENTA